MIRIRVIYEAWEANWKSGGRIDEKTAFQLTNNCRFFLYPFHQGAQKEKVLHPFIHIDGKYREKYAVVLRFKCSWLFYTMIGKHTHTRTETNMCETNSRQFTRKMVNC